MTSPSGLSSACLPFLGILLSLLPATAIACLLNMYILINITWAGRLISPLHLKWRVSAAINLSLTYVLLTCLCIHPQTVCAAWRREGALAFKRSGKQCAEDHVCVVAAFSSPSSLPPLPLLLPLSTHKTSPSGTALTVTLPPPLMHARLYSTCYLPSFAAF